MDLRDLRAFDDAADEHDRGDESAIQPVQTTRRRSDSRLGPCDAIGDEPNFSGQFAGDAPRPAAPAFADPTLASTRPRDNAELCGIAIIVVLLNKKMRAHREVARSRGVSREVLRRQPAARMAGVRRGENSGSLEGAGSRELDRVVFVDSLGTELRCRRPVSSAPSHLATTTVATPLPTRLVSARASDMNRSMPRISASRRPGTCRRAAASRPAR